MATFIVRVQLTTETPSNYEILKKAMLKAGFKKIIVGKDGRKYVLPNGNYLGESIDTILEVTKIVGAIIEKIGDINAQVLITESKAKGNSWINLPIIK